MFPGLERGYLYTIAGWRIHLSWVVLGVIGALTIGFINFRGIRMASYVQWSAAALLLAVGIAFFIPGNFRGDTANLVPHFTGLEGFFGVVIMTPFLFVGFDVIPQIAEEIDLPFRAVGRLILISIVIALGWYVLVQWTVGVTLPNQGLGERQLPTADAMAAVYGSPWGGRVLVLGGLMGILTSWNAFFIGASRLLFAMSRGAMLPAVFTRLHPRFQSPVAVILLITCCTVVAPFFGRPALVWLVDAGSVATLQSARTTNNRRHGRAHQPFLSGSLSAGEPGRPRLAVRVGHRSRLGASGSPLRRLVTKAGHRRGTRSTGKADFR
jgi:amino acid transporter